MKSGDHLSRVVLDLLDSEGTTACLSRRAHQSRSQFFRLFRALFDETPVVIRRRFLLERAAWQLGRSRASITEIALGANYGSLEAFTREVSIKRGVHRACGIQAAIAGGDAEGC